MIPQIQTNFTDNDKYWYCVGARYTMHVYDLLQNAQISNDRKSNKNLFENYDASVFGLDDYPIFDENYRKVLNDMIIRHFLEFEIGFETEFLFSEHMRSDMFRIMPEMNVKLKARKEAYEAKHMFETDNGQSSHESDDVHKFLDTPQGQADLIDDNYLTNITKNHASSNDVHSSTSGTAGTNARSYTEAVWDFETEICDALKHNFMGLFG